MLEAVEKSISATNGLAMEKLLRTSSQEVRRAIDYASGKVLLAIASLFAGQLVLLLIAARLFRPLSKKRT